MIPYLLGIYRERQHSPGREFDDTEILKLVAKHVEAAGYQVHLKTPEELREIDASLNEPWAGSPPLLVFLMCERIEALGLLDPLETKGIPHVNPLGSILNTYRDRMVPLLAASGVPIPRSQIISSNSSDSGRPSAHVGADSFPIWIKRADVHNTQSGDVELVPSPETLQKALAALHDRGISHVVLQQHVPGDLIKFYGIGRPRTNHQEDRSEEHTSELQSPLNLVCRLLLEKKKK